MRTIFGGIRAYLNIIMPYLVLVMVFIGAFLFTYTQSVAQIKERTLEQAVGTMQTAMEFIDSDFINAYSSLDLVYRQQEVEQLLAASAHIETPDFAKMIRVRQKLGLMAHSTEIIGVYALFFDAPVSIIITPDRVAYDARRLFKLNVISFGDMDYDAFVSMVRGSGEYRRGEMLLRGFSPAARLKTVEDGRFDALPFVKYLAGTGEGGQNLYGVLFLKTEKLAELILPERSPFIHYGISDSSGVLLSGTVAGGAAIDGATIVSGGGATDIALTSRRTGLTYSLRIDDGFFVEKLSYFYVFFRIMLVAMLIMSLMLLAALGGVLIRPLNALLRRLERRPEKNALKALSEAVEGLSSTNADMRELLGRWRPVIKTELIGRVLAGGSYTEEEIMSVPELVAREGGEYRVLALLPVGAPGPSPGGEQRLEAIKRRVTVPFPRSVIQPMDDGVYAALVNLPERQQWPELATKVGELAAELEREGGVYFIGVSGGHRQTAHIYLACGEAMDALWQARHRLDSPIVCYAQYDRNLSAYAFPYSHADKLVNLMISGDGRQARELLAHIMRTNFPDNGQYISSDNFRQLYFDLRGVALRSMERAGLESSTELSIPPYSDSASLPELVAAFDALFEAIARSSGEMEEGGLQRRLLQYIDENFSDSNMSLKLLSEKFHITEKYISFYFKEKNNLNFSDYLEKLRLDRAEQLLMDGALPISEIAARSGYNTVSAFYKAFKRKNGITPAKWQRLSGQ